VRRVYVTKAARRNGLARALMAQLEVEALVLGYTTLMLETGHRQQPAMALYASLGYARIPAFGAYVGDETSVCFAKTINQNAPAETSRWRRWSGGRRRSSTARRRRRAR
jgi:ribosomal protein S18 acetylase RimI-like enzyme